MERPYTICHVLTSIDGKLDGPFMGAPECADALEAYAAIRTQYDCEAVLYGTVTVKNGFSAGLAPENLAADTVYPRTDYFSGRKENHFLIAVDPEGILGWTSDVVSRKGRPTSQVIEAVTDQVSDAYLSYLRNQGVSYLFAGEKTLDWPLLCEKLKQNLGISRLMIAGGGCTDWSCLQAGCLDEVSLVIAPVADGDPDAVSVFERMSALPVHPPVAFQLAETKRIKENTLWLRYVVR